MVSLKNKYFKLKNNYYFNMLILYIIRNIDDILYRESFNIGYKD